MKLSCHMSVLGQAIALHFQLKDACSYRQTALASGGSIPLPELRQRRSPTRHAGCSNLRTARLPRDAGEAGGAPDNRLAMMDPLDIFGLAQSSITLGRPIACGADLKSGRKFRRTQS